MLLRGQLTRTDVDVPTRAGVVLRVPSLAEPIAFHLLIDGVYEPQLLEFLLDALPTNGVFVDVGANIGSFSVTIAKLRPDARVIAIEPSPTVLPYLHHNAASNQVSNLEIVPLAAYSQRTELEFYVSPATHFGMGSIAPQFHVAPIRVAADCLAAILRTRGVHYVDVIKIDAEGAEADVIAGAQQLLESADAPVIAAEFSDWAEARIPGRVPGDAQRALRKLGYQLWTLNGWQGGGAPLSEVLTRGGDTIIARKGELSTSNK